MPMNHPPDDVDETAVKQQVVAIARAAGIGHCVYQSMIGAGIAESCADDFATENALRESGMAWTILRTAIFAESLGRECKRYVREGELPALDPDQRRNYVTRDDIAAAGAAVLTGASHDGKIYHLIGANLSLRELAAELTELAGRPIEIVEGTRPAWGGDGGLGSPPNDLPALIGRPGKTVFEQLRENRQELLTGTPVGGEVRFGFQWHARGMAARPDDLGLSMHRMYRAALEGDARAAVAFGVLIGANPARHALWRQIHPEWFWWETR